MSTIYNPLNWYWSVQDTSPSTQVFASISSSFVVLADATYVSWLAQDGGNTPTVIDTAVHLWTVLDNEARSRMQPNNIGPLTQTTDITLTNPPASVYGYNVTVASKKLIMPPMRYANSFPVGYRWRVKCLSGSTQDLNLYQSDGATLIVTLHPDEAYEAQFSDNSVTNAPSANFSLLPSAAAWTSYTPTITSGSGTITGATITGSCRYKTSGKTVAIEGSLTFTDIGSGTPDGFLGVSLPPSGPTTAQSVGFSNGMDSFAISHAGYIAASANHIEFYRYDGAGTSPWSYITGHNLYFSGVYEST